MLEIRKDKNNMAKKKTAEKALNIDHILFNCRDYLRAARNSGSFFEKRDMMLTLVFLRFIGEKYEDGVEKLRQILVEQGLDPDNENIRAAFFDDATFTDGTYNLPVEARWSTIINTPAPGLNVALDAALHSIATSSKDLKGCFIEGTFTTRNLAPNDIKKLVDEVNKMAELGTQIAHVDGGVPNLKIEVPALNEYCLGQLIYFFEKACGISGYILGVNPFNQPGVEDYKRNMFALLDKPGYEEESKAIRAKI